MAVRVHGRESIVTRTESEMTMAVLDILEKADLTSGEELRALTSVFSGLLQNTAKYMIREERHRRDDKPGGLA